MSYNGYVFRTLPVRPNLLWDNACYFDIETLRWNEWNKIDKSVGLDPRKRFNQFCILIPKAKVSRRKLDIIQNLKIQETTIHDVEFLSILHKSSSYFKNVNTVLDILLCLRKPIPVCTYNGFRFDVIPFTRSSRVRYSMSPAKIFKTIIDERRSIRWYDLKLWAQGIGMIGGLDVVGESLGFPKLKGWKSAAEYDEYNRRDVRILAEFVHRLNELGFTSHTLPKEGRAKLGNAYYQQGVHAVYSSAHFSRFDSYGARCEPYFAILDGGAVFDVNSLYPSVMAHFPYPKLHRKGNKAAYDMKRIPKNSPTWNLLQDAVRGLTIHPYRSPQEAVKAWHSVMGNTLLMSKVRILSTYDDQTKFVFPFAYRDKDGGIHWKHDPEAIYEVFGFEHMHLASYCRFEMLELYISESEPLITAKHIKSLYERRQKLKQEGSPYELGLKTELNVGFGITIPDGRKSYPITDRDIIAHFRETVDVFGQYGLPVEQLLHYQNGEPMLLQDAGHFLRARPIKEKRYLTRSIPPVGIFTLSHARFFMYFHMRKLMEQGHYPLYTDTDSLFVKKDAVRYFEENDLIGSEMLQFKKETDIWKGVVVAPKCYTYVSPDEKLTLKWKGGDGIADRTMYIQSIVQELRTIIRRAYDPESPQKRTLDVVDGEFVFLNKVGSKNDIFEDNFRRMIELANIYKQEVLNNTDDNDHKNYSKVAV